jgi:hypothetical protein
VLGRLQSLSLRPVPQASRARAAEAAALSGAAAAEATLMATKHPMRFLQPDPKLTKELRVTLAVAAEVMATYEVAVTEAMRDPTTRRELRQWVSDLASLLDGVQDHAKKVGGRL